MVIDLDFGGLMSEGELRSLCQQLSYSYAANIRAEQPCHLHLLGCKGEVKEQLERQISGEVAAPAFAPICGCWGRAEC